MSALHANTCVILMMILYSDAAKVGEKRVYLFTDAESEFNSDQLDQICDGVKSMDIHLTIV